MKKLWNLLIYLVGTITTIGCIAIGIIFLIECFSRKKVSNDLNVENLDDDSDDYDFDYSDLD